MEVINSFVCIFWDNFLCLSFHRSIIPPCVINLLQLISKLRNRRKFFFVFLSLYILSLLGWGEINLYCLSKYSNRRKKEIYIYTSNLKSEGNLYTYVSCLKMKCLWWQGTMLLELSKTCSIPVAIEMDQGCPSSDAWLLLQRIKSSGSSQHRENHRSNVITLSPWLNHGLYFHGMRYQSITAAFLSYSALDSKI